MSWFLLVCTAHASNLPYLDCQSGELGELGVSTSPLLWFATALLGMCRVGKKKNQVNLESMREERASVEASRPSRIASGCEWYGADVFQVVFFQAVLASSTCA